MAEYSNNYIQNTTDITLGTETYKFSRVVSTVNPSTMDNSCIYCGSDTHVKYDYYPCYMYTGDKLTLMNSVWSVTGNKFKFTDNSKDSNFNISFALCDYSSTVQDSGINSVYQIGKTIYNEGSSSSASNIRILNPTDIRKFLFRPQFDGCLGTSNSITSNVDIKYLMDHSDDFYVTAIRISSIFWNGSNYTSTPTRLERIRPCIIGDDYFLPLTTCLGTHEFVTDDYNTHKSYNQSFFGAYDSDGMGIDFFSITGNEEITFSFDPSTTNLITDNRNKYYSSYNSYITTYRLYPPAKQVIKLLAYCGCYFVDSSYNTSGKNLNTFWNDEHIYLGEMKEGARTTGVFIKGTDLLTSDTINKGEYSSQTNFNPAPGPSGDDEDNTDPVSTTGAPFGTGLAHYYVTTVDSAVLGQISEALGSWDIDTSKKDLYRNLISCKILKPPAGIPSTPSTFEIYGVKPQYNGADISIPAVNGNPDITFGPYSISRKFNDFRDYAPYTRAEIFLPYCGWCALPSHVVGRSVSVSYFTDVIAGTVKAVVFCGENPVAEAAGVMAYDIPFASQNVGAKIQAANTGMLAYGKAALQLSAGIGQAVATKGKQGMSSIVNGAFGVAAGYNQLSMAANENYTEISGKAGDGCALAGIDTIIIKIVRPKYGAYTTPPYVPEGFAHTVGFLSMKQAKVSAASGLILCDNVDTSGIGKATDAERAEIKRVLETGLYVNNPPE